MPPAIAAAIAWFAAATAFEIAVTLGSLALTVGTTVFGTVQQQKAAKKSKRAAAKAREDFLNSLQERTVTRIATEAPHVYVYGRAKVGSAIVGMFTSGDNDEYRHLVCIHAAHECEEIEEVYINAKALGVLDADGYVTDGDYYSTKTSSITENFATSPFTLAHTPSSAIKVIAHSAAWSGSIQLPYGAQSSEVAHTRSGDTITVTGIQRATIPNTTVRTTGYSVTYQYKQNTSQVRVKKHLGAAGQVADADLMTAAPEKWKSTATLDGFCYTVITLDLRQDEFQGGVPTVDVLLKGKKLYDPRTSLTAWSDNPALVVYDYLTSEVCGVDADDLPVAHYITAANVCDEVQTFGALYTCNGTATADQDQANVLEAMADSMAGGIVSTTWEIFAGKYVAPAASLTQEDIVGSLAVTPGISDADLINGVRGQNITEANFYVATDYPPYQNATYAAADGKDKYADISYPFTDAAHRVNKLARILVEDQRNGFTVKAEFSLKAWDIHVGDRVTFTSAFLGQTDKVYRITDKKYSPSSAIELTMKEDGPTIWDLVDTFTLDDTPNTDLPNPFVVDPLSFVTCNSGSDALLIQQDGTIISRILVTWGAAAGAVANGGIIEIEWQRNTETVWRKTTATGDETGVFLSPVEDMAWYVVRARPWNPYLNVRADWTYADLHQVIGKSAPPSDLEDLSIDGSILSWTEVVDLDLAGYVFRFHYGNNLDWGSASPLHNGIVTDSPYNLLALPYGAVTIMGKAVDTSGNESVNAGAIITDLGDAPVANVVETHSFHPTFAGTLTNCSVSGGNLLANAADSFYADDAQSFYGASGSFYKPAAGFGQMVYESGVMSVSSALVGSKITLALASEGADVTIEYKISGEGSFYGADGDSFYAAGSDGFFSTSPDAFYSVTPTGFDVTDPNSFYAVDVANFDPTNPDSFYAVDPVAFADSSMYAASASSSAWLPWPGQITARNGDYQFRVTIGSGATQGKITSFVVTIDAPDLIESFTDLVISSSGTAIPYTKNFTSIKFVTFGALEPGVSGAERLEIEKTTPLVRTVRAFNGAGVAVSGAKVDGQIGGY